MPIQNALKRLLAGVLVSSASCLPVAAQLNSTFLNAASALANSAERPSGYDQPPKAILDVMHAPSPPEPRVSPTGDSILLVSWETYPSISRVAAPFLRLAGVRVEPKNHSKHDTPGGYGITPCARSFDLVHIADGAQIHIALPNRGCPGRPVWSADGKRFAFVNLASESVELWIGEAKSGEVHSVAGARLNPMFNAEMQWMPDQRMLLVKLVPAGMGAPPAEPILPVGPSIQETEGEKGQSSTYENRDTLNNEHDEDLFDYYAASQLALVDADDWGDHTNRKARELLFRRSRSGRTAHPRLRDPQAILVRRPRTIAFPRKLKCGMCPRLRTFWCIRLHRFRSRTGFQYKAFQLVRAISPGAPPILPR